jgi:precorrin-2 dehydrogenase / sirohydrochlorin ferrochelatase
MDSPAYYMACLDLTGRSVLVVGGGPVALEKVEGLVAARACVTVVAPEIVPELAAIAAAERVDLTFARRSYRSQDLTGRFLVVAATSTTEVNRRVFADAEARSILCNVVDVPELCSFILPAVHRHEPIAVAVSTGGASPALAQHLRDQIATVVRPEHAELAHRLRALRPWAKAHFATYEERKVYFAGIVAEELG